MFPRRVGPVALIAVGLMLAFFAASCAHQAQSTGPDSGEVITGSETVRDGETVELEKRLGGTVMELILDSAPLENVMEMLRESARINVVASPSIKSLGGPLFTVWLSKLPIDRMLRRMLGAQGLGYYVDSGVVVVATKAEADSMDTRAQDILVAEQAAGEANSRSVTTRMASTPIDHAFGGVSLWEALQTFHSRGTLDIVLDASATTRKDFPVQKVAFESLGLPLDKALRYLLLTCGLSFRVSDGVVVVHRDGGERYAFDDGIRERATNSRMELDFDGATLHEAVMFLSQFSGMTIVLDPAIGKAAGIAVELKAENSSPHSVLTSLTAEHDLDFYAYSGALIIAPKAVAAARWNSIVQEQARLEAGKAAATPQQIEAKLATRVDMDFTDARLSDVLGFFEEFLKLEFKAEGEVDQTEVLTISLRDLPAGNCLCLVLSLKGLDWKIENGAIVVFRKQ
ncbi:MAG: hypothetical protein RDV41_02660 [Planctomycetota bacterium]|nr:hypothetical protein [Planctomycetota bacterium]